MSIVGTTRLNGVCPHFFGKFLILDLDRDDARVLIAAHGVMDVEQAAIAGVGVGDDAGLHDARERRNPVEHLRIGRDAGVGQTVGGGGQPEARGVDEVEADLVGDHRRDHVVQARRGHEFVGAQRRAQASLGHWLPPGHCAARQSIAWRLRTSCEIETAITRPPP